jgi:hypothetical protein
VRRIAFANRIVAVEHLRNRAFEDARLGRCVSVIPSA